MKRDNPFKTSTSSQFNFNQQYELSPSNTKLLVQLPVGIIITFLSSSLTTTIIYLISKKSIITFVSEIRKFIILKLKIDINPQNRAGPVTESRGLNKCHQFLSISY